MRSWTVECQTLQAAEAQGAAQKQLEWLGMKSEIQVCHQKLEQLRAEDAREKNFSDMIEVYATESAERGRRIIELQAERDAAVVQGLERAKEIASHDATRI